MSKCPAGYPPGPRLPAILQTALLGFFFNTVARWGHDRYGTAFTARFIPPGHAADPLVMSSDSQDLRQVLTGPASTFLAGENNSMLESVVGASSVLLLDGSKHTRMRKLMTPAFIGQSLRDYETQMTTIAESVVQRWPIGQEFSVIERTQELTLDIIIRVIFGVEDPTHIAALKPAIKTLLGVTPGGVLSVYYPGTRKLGFGRRFHRARAGLENFLSQKVTRCRENPTDKPTDVCSRLVHTVVDGERLSDAEVVDQLLTLLVAGHETTATALAWVLHDLARQPEVQERAGQAADEGNLAYLRAILLEGMRIHPPVTGIGRKLAEPVVVGDKALQAGSRIVFAGTIMHNDPKYHDFPHRFSPERFLGDAPPAGDVYFPFGGGVRRCIGASFALEEGSRLLSAVLRRYQVTANRKPESEVTKFMTITAPSKGGRIYLHPR